MTKNVPSKKKKSEVAEPMKPGRGYGDNISKDDLLLPRVELLQGQSPVVLDGKRKAGEIVNSISKEPLPEDLKIIPVLVEKNFIRWKPREQGGGIEYRTKNPYDPRVMEDTKWHGDEKPKCTAYLNFLCFIEGQDMPIVVSFCNTSYQTGRKLLTLSKMEGGDIFNRKFRLGALKRENKYGIFYIFTVENAGSTNSEERSKAESLLTVFKDQELMFQEDDSGSGSESTDAGEDNNEF